MTSLGNHYHRRPIVRSSPIAIANNSDSIICNSSDDEEEFVSGISALQLDDRNNVTYVGSLPVKQSCGVPSTRTQKRRKSLPGAPKLSSIDVKNEDFSLDSEPPPMQLTEHVESHLAEETSTPYGSLRESHLDGKFNDGPSSYRDKSSGQIHLLHYNTKDMRLIPPANQTLIPPPKMEMPGERMQSASSVTTKSASSLSTLMKGATLPPSQQPQGIALCSSFDPRDHHRHQQENNGSILSTSLTGFEVLQAARNHPDLLKNTTSSVPEPPAFLTPAYDDDGEDEGDNIDENDQVFQLDME